MTHLIPLVSFECNWLSVTAHWFTNTVSLFVDMLTANSFINVSYHMYLRYYISEIWKKVRQKRSRQSRLICIREGMQTAGDRGRIYFKTTGADLLLVPRTNCPPRTLLTSLPAHSGVCPTSAGENQKRTTLIILSECGKWWCTFCYCPTYIIFS